MEKQKIARIMNATLTPRTTGTLVGGSAKFGTIPGGGCPAGIVFSRAGGMLSGFFGSTWRVKLYMSGMVPMTEVCLRDKSGFHSERPRIDLIYIHMAMKNGSPCARTAVAQER